MVGVFDIIPDDTAFSLELDSEAASGDAEAWSAQLQRCVLDYEEDDVIRGPVVASASLYRVHFGSGDWYEDLDEESHTAEVVGAAFRKRHEFEDEDLVGLFSSALVVIDDIEVPEKWRGAKLSHGLIRAITSVFRSDHIGLLPSQMSEGPDGQFRLDLAKESALRRHWEGVGFRLIPGSSVMWLPFEGRAL
ncbi:hypothetical protein OHB93_02240 [Microbacterium sp. No. 7]|uniref:hypothetical protein n=1 Tax=Microbacterium sp. No. 7 TaxID=1714373 RepID=UPI003008FFB0